MSRENYSSPGQFGEFCLFWKAHYPKWKPTVNFAVGWWWWTQT